MIEIVSQIVGDAAASLARTGETLMWPAIVFAVLGFVVKRGQLFEDVRRAAAESSLNMQILLFNVLITGPMIVISTQFLWEAVNRFDLILVSPETWAAWPPLLVMLLCLAMSDFIGYWRHRLEHTRFLWPTHAIHHSDTEMTWFAIERFHPINRMMAYSVEVVMLMMMGFPPFAVMANGLIRHYYGAFIHADLPWTYGPLGRIFVSPAMHRWHHSLDPHAFDTNYANIFSLWDQAFGTFRVPGPCDVPTGISHEIDRTLLGQLAHPLRPSSYADWTPPSEHVARAEAGERAAAHPAE